MHRRTFLKSTALAGTGYLAGPLIRTRSRVKTYRTALIGSGWWGMNILRTAIAAGETQAVALCDADERAFTGAADELETLTGTRPNLYRDFRELVQRERPEIVIVATPDHWHALNTIAALNAGAHVYIEKPISHTLNEGKAILKAARDANRVVQVGTHRRVSPHNMSAMAFLRSGQVGDIGMVRTFVHYGGGPGSPTPDESPPEGLDWDLWCGPAPMRAYNPRIHPRGFRQYLDYANGQLGDWGIHWLDQILWWTDEAYPRRIASTGDRHIKRDGTDAPDTQIATFEFESFTATWEHRQYAANRAENHSIGCYFYGTGGTLHLGWRDGWTFYPSDGKKETVHVASQLNEPDHQNIHELWMDFINAIETGAKPACDIESGYRATNMCLLGMIALQTGRTLAWDGDKGQVMGDPAANAMLSRPYRGEWEYPW
ncbi:MAG: Gfo/Idh/MocA family oxidoreductase [Bacteroidota bacterium]